MADSAAGNNFNLFISALSLVTAISSTVLCCRAFLPRAQMRLFVEIMAETKAMLLEADQKGLIQNESIRRSFTIKIEQLEDLGTDLHDKICEARTQFEEHIAALKGLSRAMIQLVGRARYLRSWIATYTAQEKHRRQAERELAADRDRANLSHQADQQSIDTPPPTRIDTTDDLGSARTDEMLPACPPTTHDCCCAPCPIHHDTEARLGIHTVPPYAPIWRRLWPSPRPDMEMFPEHQV